MEHLDSAAGFEALRGRLFGIAYRMLGSRAEAEDIVQDAYVRWRRGDRDAIRNHEAWLVTTATRLSIDRLRALKTEREAYLGPWLPEPLMSSAPPPDRDLEIASDLSIAFLVMLERLAPEERAAFLLHEVFDQGYPEIAETLGKSEAACRQIVHRARERVRKENKRFATTEAAKVRLLQQFTAAVEEQNETALLALFTPDATWTADGGGRTSAAIRPILGAEKVVRLLLGLRRRFGRDNLTFQLVSVNGEPGLTMCVDGHFRSVIAVETDGGRIRAAYAVLNPEKLAAACHTEPVDPSSP